MDGSLARSANDVVYVPAVHYTTQEKLLSDVDTLASLTRGRLVEQHRRGALLAAGCSGSFLGPVG